MDQQRHGMLLIGGFASAAQLSLKALRLYDQLGLLKPSYVDRDRATATTIQTSSARLG